LKKNRSKPASVADLRIPLMVCVLIGVFLLAVYTVVVSFTTLPPSLFGIILTVIYIYTAIFTFLGVRNRLRRIAIEEERAAAFNTEIYQMFRETIDLPYAIVSVEGRVTIINRALQEILGKPYLGVLLEEICGASAGEIIAASEPNGQLSLDIQNGKTEYAYPGEGMTVGIRRRRFLARGYPMTVNGTRCYMIVFTEITALVELREKMKRENTVVAFIMLDNLEELAQYVRVSYRQAANEIDAILKNWAASMKGLLREYDRDRYLLIITREMLDECIKNKFEILDSIRDVRLGDDSMSVTVSMGISVGIGPLSERENEAMLALDLALQRGGDQVVIRHGNETEFFGGRSKGMQKRTRVRSRVNAAVLSARISESSNVLVMGHKNPDFDSIGACVGIARLCIFCGVPVRIVADQKSDNFRIIAERLSRNSEYADMFTDALSGLDLVKPDTLLIICDANNFNIIEAPDIADSVDRIAIIDHHRQTEQFDFEPLVNYIDPVASSTCELVAEILEQSVPADTILRDEANAMYAGIMLDTKFFTKDTGTRTFAAALYLQSEGAKSEVVRQYFEEDFSDYLAEAKFSSDIELYRGNIAITRSIGTGNAEQDRTAASKAADKLLTIRQVDAAFALVSINDEIRVSARSSGKINVQLILEKLKGGGHFNAAAAQVNGTMDHAYKLLTEAIDEYLDNA
jgi:c-di-AMP phosphodiesterase-like protein